MTRETVCHEPTGEDAETNRDASGERGDEAGGRIAQPERSREIRRHECVETVGRKPAEGDTEDHVAHGRIQEKGRRDGTQFTHLSSEREARIVRHAWSRRAVPPAARR